MRNKILLLIPTIILTSVNLFALDINEAVNQALKNNKLLKKQQYIMEESKLSVDQSYGAYHPRVDLAYTYSHKDELIATQIKEDSVVSASVSYNLFNGLKDKYNISASKELFNSSKYLYEALKQDLILDVKSKYIDYLLKQKNVLTFKEALLSYEKQYKDSLNFFNQGLIAQNELLEVEVQMLQAKQNLQSAISDKKIAGLSLQNITGVKIEDQIEDLNFNDEVSLKNSSIENRSELKALQASLEALKNTKKSLRSSYMPKVDAALSINSYGDSISPDSRTGYPDEQTIGSVSVSWNLYKGQTDRIEILKQNKKLKQTIFAIEDLKEQLNLQLENAKEQLNLSKLNLKTAKKALESSKLNYEIVEKKVKEGISSNKDLIDANYLYTKAKQNYFNAYYNRYLSIAKLQRIVEKQE